MVELFPTRRRAEEFARALEGDAQTSDARLQQLLDTAAGLAAVPLVQPRPEFRDALRARLMEAAAAELPAQAAERTRSRSQNRTLVDDPREVRRRRRLVAAATGLVLVGGGTGVAAASEQALPGDMLYPVKRTLEAAQVSLAQGAEAEGRALLDRATTRLEETATLTSQVATGEGDVEAVVAALREFAADAAAGGDRLLESYAADGDPAALQTLRDFTGDSHRVLGELAESLPPEAQSEVTAADDTVVTLDGLAKQACPDCTESPPLVGLPTEPLSALGGAVAPRAGATDTPGQDRAGLRDHRGQQGTQSPDTKDTDTGGQATAPALPDLRLDSPTREQQSQDDDAAPSQGDGGDTQQGPRLDTCDQLNPAPAAPRRTTDAPAPGHLDDVTEPLTEPLTDPLAPLVDGTGDTLDQTRDDGLL
jgi:hypothetical protein